MCVWLYANLYICDLVVRLTFENINCAQIKFIFDSRWDVLVNASKFRDRKLFIPRSIHHHQHPPTPAPPPPPIYAEWSYRLSYRDQIFPISYLAQGMNILFVILTFEMSSVHRQQHIFSTQENVEVFVTKCIDLIKIFFCIYTYIKYMYITDCIHSTRFDMLTCKAIEIVPTIWPVYIYIYVHIYFSRW